MDKNKSSKLKSMLVVFLISLALFAVSFWPRNEGCCDYYMSRSFGWPETIFHYGKLIDHTDIVKYSNMSVSELKADGFKFVRGEAIPMDPVSFSLLLNYSVSLFFSALLFVIYRSIRPYIGEK